MLETITTVLEVTGRPMQASEIHAAAEQPAGRCYRQAVKTALPGARIGCDPFHLVRGANTALDTTQARAPARGPRFAWLRR